VPPQAAGEPLSAEPTPEPERKSRAGRNLPAAIAVALGLAALILASLYIEKVAFVGVACVAIMLAVWELSAALGTKGIQIPVVPVLVGAVAILVAAYAGGPEPLVVALVLTSMAVLVWRIPEGPEGFVRDATAGVFCTVYVPFLAGFAMLMLLCSSASIRWLRKSARRSRGRASADPSSRVLPGERSCCRCCSAAPGGKGCCSVSRSCARPRWGISASR
jgi:phosphatidate cytidylyltransferase